MQSYLKPLHPPSPLSSLSPLSPLHSWFRRGNTIWNKYIKMKQMNQTAYVALMFFNLHTMNDRGVLVNFICRLIYSINRKSKIKKLLI